MEIADYLRIARRRLWLLILVPLVVVGAVVFLVLRTPPQYSATATLSTTAFVGNSSYQFTGTQAASQFAAAYTAASSNPRVLALVAKKTHVPPAELSSGLTVLQSGLSSDMILTYTSTDESEVRPVLRAVNRQTLDNMFAFQVQLAKQEVTKASAAVAKANQDLTSYKAQYGPQDPNTLYRAQLVHAAVRALVSAKSTYQTALTQLNAVRSATNLYVGTPHKLSPTSKLISTAVPALAAAIFLTVILVAMLEWIAAARRRPDPYIAAHHAAQVR